MNFKRVRGATAHKQKEGESMRWWGTPFYTPPVVNEYIGGETREWGEGVEAPLLLCCFRPSSFSFLRLVVPISFSTPMHPCLRILFLSASLLLLVYFSAASLLLPLYSLIRGGDAHLHSRQPHTGFTSTVYPLERCNALSS